MRAACRQRDFRAGINSSDGRNGKLKKELKECAVKIVKLITSSRAQNAFTAFALAFVIFAAGTAVMFFKVYPSQYFRNAFAAAKSIQVLKSEYDAPYPVFLWTPVRSGTKKSGVLVYDKQRAYDGYTLFSSTYSQSAFLISMKGEIVHKWSLPYRQIWDDRAAVKKLRPENNIYFNQARLFPNGDLMVIYAGNGATPVGYGLAKMDKDSNLIWKYLESVHHDFDIGEDGKVYALSHYLSSGPDQELFKVDTPIIEDYVVLLSPDGQEIKRVSLLKALLNSPFRRSLSLRITWDLMHANGVTVVTSEMAKRLPFAKSGQVLVSLRIQGAMVLVDLDKETVVWVLKGPWVGQHDPDILKNGNFLLFDNLGDLDQRNGRSRILEFNPITMEIVWTYRGEGKEYFFSRLRSSQQRLPNGNTFINEAEGGRLFEVTSDNEKVWEYSNPFRPQGQRDGKNLIAVITAAQRYDRQDINFEFNRLED